MQSFIQQRFSRVALVAGMAAAACSPASFACTMDPVMASICIMAVPTSYGSFNHSYMLAAGQELPVNAYAALYSLIGVTYGGTGQSTFKLPDLRGRFVIAADGTTYATGATGGSNAVALTVAQLPAHNFTVTALPVDLTRVTVSTPLSTLSGTVSIASSVATGTVSDLKVNTVNGSGGQGTPSGNYLGKSPNAFGNLYSGAAPDTTLNAGTISGGKVSVTIPASSAPVSLAGGTVTGTVVGTATASGNTNTLGTGAPFDNRPSYIALTYYIATTGLYPSRD